MLERYAVKFARTVLRGESNSNVTPLPDPGKRQKMDEESLEPGKRRRDFIFLGWF